MALSFDATYYMSARPDVLNAYIAAGAEAGTGMNWAQFAEQHYNDFGWKEGYNPNAIFDTTEYLAANIDVLNAGVNPFQHYLQFGAYEKRAPSDSFISFEDFDWETYLAANSDLTDAGIDTAEAAYAHFVIFGQFESRPGAPVVDTGIPGATTALTTGTDVLVGTAGNDTFIAGVVKSLDGLTDLPTLTAGDSIDGGAGVDKIDLVGNGNMAAFVGANIKNVEQVFASATATGASLNVTGNADVKEAWLANTVVTHATAGDAALSLTKAQVAGIKGNVTNDGALGSTTDINVNFAGATGTADAATLAVDGVKLVKNVANTTGKLGVNVANIETLTIAATGANNIGVLTAAAADKLIINGAGSLTVELSNAAKYKNIDASTNSGGVSIDARAANVANQVLDIKGGSGNDSYTTLFANLTKDDKIDLGVGNDKLLFADAVALSNAAAAEKLAGVSNVETLGVVGTAGLTVDAEFVSQSVFQVGSTGAFAGTNMSNTDKLVVSGNAIATSTIGMKTGQNTTNIDLAGSAAAAADASNGITVTGASVINVSSTGATGVARNALNLTTDANGTVNVEGSQNLVLTTATATATAGLSIQAGSFTGRLDVTGTAQNDIIVAGSGNDHVKASIGADTISLGAGSDVLIYTNANQTLTDVGTAAGILASIDKVLDWDSSADKITFNAAVDFKALTLSQQGDVAAAADIKIALDLVAGYIAVGDQTAFNYDGNTYVYANAGAAGAGVDDYLVQLVGTHTLTADNLLAATPTAIA